MARLIDADKLMKAIKSDKVAWRFGVPNTLGLLFDYLRIIIKEQPTVDAVEVVRIEEVKQKILETLDTLMATDAELASYDGENSYYRGKANAFEIARRLFNAALIDLAKMDGERNGNERKAD